MAKFPPLGLMKIATAHRILGDDVCFVKGKSRGHRDKPWKTIYIATMFTFNWNATIDTINFYNNGKNKIVIGGVLASLMPEEIFKETGIRPIVGVYDGDIDVILEAAQKDTDFNDLLPDIERRGVDALPPAYDLFGGLEIPAAKLLENTYFLRSSRGCHRKCPFCAVGKIESDFHDRINIKPVKAYIDKKWGEKQNLILMDDNVLQSPHFTQIIDEIISLGFQKGARFQGKKRYVDFNQGLDVRLLEKKHISKLASIELRPLRLAFDDISLKNIYIKKVKWAIEAGFKEINSYVLYNFNDRPSELYERIKIGCDINSFHGCRIYSFPMKYIPCGDTDRNFLGEHWTRRQIRGVQCILNASKGVVRTKESFFKIAFGNDLAEFLQIIQMPEHYIISRMKPEYSQRICDWKAVYMEMSDSERGEAVTMISGGKNHVEFNSANNNIVKFLSHYRGEVKEGLK